MQEGIQFNTNKMRVEHLTQVELIYSKSKRVAFPGTQPTLLSHSFYLGHISGGGGVKNHLHLSALS